MSVIQKRVERDFERTTRDHELTVVHDAGLYRHLRIAKPGTYCYGYDIVTWPGHLVIAGDIGDWTFQRVTDMFQFFRSESGRINPDYWAQKVQVGMGSARDVTRRFSRDRVQEVAREWARNACEVYGIHGEDDWEYTTAMYPHLLADALVRELRHHEEPHSVESAIRVFDAIEADVRADTRWEVGHEISVGLTEMWEYDYTEYDGSFLRCCMAIVKAIAMYDEARDRVEVAA